MGRPRNNLTKACPIGHTGRKGENDKQQKKISKRKKKNNNVRILSARKRVVRMADKAKANTNIYKKITQKCEKKFARLAPGFFYITKKKLNASE